MTKKTIRRNSTSDFGAFILAAGKGTRLRPYTDNRPKPLVEVNGKPILDYALDKLQNEGIKNATVNVSYLGDRIENHLAARQTPTITISRETVLLETGGGVKYALDTMQGKPFYLINGDALWTDGGDKTTLARLAEAWDSARMDILLLLQPLEAITLTEGSGDYNLSADGQAVRSLNRQGAYMFGGIRITTPDIFDGTPDGAFSFLELMDKAQSQGRLYGLVHDGEWHHISTPEDLDRVNAAFSATTTSQAETT